VEPLVVDAEVMRDLVDQRGIVPRPVSGDVVCVSSDLV
jgi:hypothetical protein